MHVLRCLHPPGGATALLPVIGGPLAQHGGFGFLLDPIGVNVAVLLGMAWVINNMIPGRRWPLRPAAAKGTAAERPWPIGRLGLTRDDLDAALRDMHAVIDVDESDLEEIYARASLHALQRRLGEVRAADIMTRDVLYAEYGDSLEEVWARMRARGIKGVPVVDRARRVIGMLTIVDFMKHAGGCRPQRPPLLERICQFIRRSPGLYSDKPDVVGHIMSRPAITARADAHIVTLVPLFAENGIHHLPIVDGEGRLAGIVTQSDLLDALYALNEGASASAAVPAASSAS